MAQVARGGRRQEVTIPWSASGAARVLIRSIRTGPERGEAEPTGAQPNPMKSLDARIPPLVLVVAAAVLMWIAARFVPVFTFPVPARGLVSLVLGALGMLVAAAGILEFRRARTTVNPMTPGAASALVVRGVFRISRNPMYLGFALILLGWAVFLQSATAFVVLVAFIVYIDRFQIRPEEQALEKTFGVTFRDYARRVRRWL
jgi:protein-S-isoprenylcysteine O-methyltransferase Ste14